MLASVRDAGHQGHPARGTPLRDDLADAYLGQFLAVAGLPAVLLALLELEDVDLLAPGLGHDLREHPGAGQGRLADLHRAAIGHEQDPVQVHLAAHLSRDALPHPDGPGLDPVLFSTRFDDGVHGHSFPFGAALNQEGWAASAIRNPQFEIRNRSCRAPQKTPPSLAETGSLL